MDGYCDLVKLCRYVGKVKYVSSAIAVHLLALRNPIIEGA